MIDNFAGKDIHEAFEEERREMEEAVKKRASVRAYMMLASAMLGASGFAAVVWFDWRLALGLFLITWSEKISKDYRQ